MSAGWRIKAWERSRGRGVVTSTQAGDLPFDASVALVDDFVVGEPVELELRRDGTTYRVTKLWPDDPHFRPPTAVPSGAPALDDALARTSAKALAAADGALDYRVASFGEDLVIEGDDDNFAYGADVVLTLAAVAYVELPAAWDGKSLRLADAAERDYLATRHDFTADTVAVRIVDADRRIYFVTCAEVSSARRKPP